MRRIVLAVAYVFGAVALYLAIVFGRELTNAQAKRTEYSSNAAEVRAGLEETARQMNLKTPFMLDGVTRLDSVDVIEESLYYRYSFPALSAKEVDGEKLHRQTRRQLVQKACSSAKVMFTLRYGARYVHSYSGNDGQVITDIEIKDGDCAKLAGQQDSPM
jgi:hypothetical protein